MPRRACGVDVSVGLEDHVAQPLVGPDELADDRPGNGQRGGDLEAGEKLREGSGELDLPETFSAVAPMVEVTRGPPGPLTQPGQPEITIGKNAISTATIIFGPSPNPSQTTNSGAIAILGMTCAKSTTG